MLILSRKLGESIVIDGRITVKIVRLEGEIVKLGIDAPLEVPVHRQEVYEEIQRNNREALAGETANVPTLSTKTGVPSTRPSPQSGGVTTPKTRGQ
jgi:carbon storage regulator